MASGGAVAPPHPPTGGGSSSPPGQAGSKDRKKSAHWTDSDTEVLINVLLRHRETGRTTDNGFKPGVWDEASGLLERTMYMGGPKTPDACKSRWQRLQRDYKVVRELEALRGFSWDRNQHRLHASEEAWEAAEKVRCRAMPHVVPRWSSSSCPPTSRSGSLCVTGNNANTHALRRSPKPRSTRRSTCHATISWQYCVRPRTCAPAHDYHDPECHPHRWHQMARQSCP